MPVRSLHSSVIKWPNTKAVDGAVRAWAQAEVRRHPDILRVGYFGSYARGDWGVGSDLDLLIINKESKRPFWERSLDFDLLSFPVATEVLVYSEAEWQAMARESGRFYKTVQREAVWIYPLFAIRDAFRG